MIRVASTLVWLGVVAALSVAAEVSWRLDQIKARRARKRKK